MKAASVNVQDNPDHPIPVVRRFLLRIKMFLGVIGFVGFQEIHDESDKDAVRRAFPASRYHHLWFETDTPGVLHRRWRIIGKPHKQLAIHGEKNFTPNRSGCFVDAERDRKKPGKRHRFINYHQINRAWNGKEHDAEVLRKRRHLWATMHHVIGSIVNEANLAGYHCVITRDDNRTNSPLLHEDEVMVGQHGIDKVSVVPAPGYRTVKAGSGFMRRIKPFDHPGVWARFWFTKIVHRVG